MNNLESIIGNTEIPKPSIIQDPFELSNIKLVMIHSLMGYDGVWSHIGKVEFRRGNTEGTQKFTGKTMDDVIYQIKQFLKQISEQ